MEYLIAFIVLVLLSALASWWFEHLHAGVGQNTVNTVIGEHWRSQVDETWVEGQTPTGEPTFSRPVYPIG